MAVISIASDKGGVSKTSLALLIGAEAALDGYKVCIIDSDINQQAAAFGEKANVPGLSVVGNVDEGNILGLLRRAETPAQLILEIARTVAARFGVRAVQIELNGVALIGIRRVGDQGLIVGDLGQQV